MAPTASPIRDLLTSFSPASDFLALSAGDGRIKVWDAVRGHLQTEFADIPAVEAGALPEAKRGHLALDYTCMKWVQLSKRNKRKAGCSLLVLGTGSGDVLSLDVSLGQWRWRIGDCHPGGVTAVAYTKHGRSVYTAGTDGMVCKINASDGSVAGKFRSSSKAVSALAVSSDGTTIATAAGQLRIFDASDHKKIKKNSGHPVAVRSMIFSDNGHYVLSSGVGERYVAIWKLGSSETKSSNCLLSMEHPAIFVDCKCSDTNATEGEIHVLAISEIGICYFWSGTNMDDLRNKKPTKIALAGSSISRAFTIFAAKLQGINGPDSAHVLLAYGSLVKPSFDKLLFCYGKDINLGVSEDGILLPTIQSTMPQKGQSTKKKGTIIALDRANAEDAIRPLPKLHTQEKKRKHVVTQPSDDIKPAIHDDRATTTGLVEKRGDHLVTDQIKTSEFIFPYLVTVQRIEDNSVCIEDMMREYGIIDRVHQTMEGHPDIATTILSDLFISSNIKVEANVPTKKIGAHLRSLKPEDACKLLDDLVSAWRTGSCSAKLVLQWIYCLLVIHGRFIPFEKSKIIISNLEKMCAERYSANEDLLKLSGRLRLIMAQVDKDAKDVSEPPSDAMRNSPAAQSDEEEDETDEIVYGEDADSSDDSE